MAHYAFLDNDNIVIEVITGKDESDTTPDGFDSWEEYYLSKRPNATSCKRTSYNTYGNSHNNGGTAFRGNFAEVGFTYNTDNDVFVPPAPPDYEGWTFTLNTSTWIYEGVEDE
jgi:hypothetical protein